jgi:hypothetical protein
VATLRTAVQAALAHQVTIVAASGDIGVVGEPCSLLKVNGAEPFTPVKEASLPASDPLVLAAGGTTLNASHQTGGYISETGWGPPYGNMGTSFQGSGGGTSASAPNWASSTRRCTASRPARSITGPSTTSPAGTTRCASRPRPSPATRPAQAGTRSPGWAPRTRNGWSRC